MTRAKATCSVGDCEQVVQGWGLCQTHYLRWKTRGTVEKWMPPVRTCSVGGCERKHEARGYCAMHYMRWKHHGTPDLLPVSAGSEHPSWSDSPTYNTTHSRTRRIRGRAASYLCTGCDKQAREWAYDKLDPDERVETDPGSADFGRVYSLDPYHYVPMCRRCHVAVDLIRSPECPQGHGFTDENTAYYNGSRYCKQCNRDKVRAYNARKKAERVHAG